MSTHMQEKVQEIQNELKAEIETHQTLTNRYKKCHRFLKTSEFILNMTSIGCHSTALVNLISSLGTVSAVLSSIGIITNGFSVFCSQWDKKKLCMLERHKQLLLICRQIDREIIQKYLNDAEITQEDFNGIVASMQSYYDKKERINSHFKERKCS